MSESPTLKQPAAPALSAALKKLAIAALFALVLLIPKLLRLRRDPRSWLAFRIALGITGAALVVLPLGLWNAWLLSIAGLAMFMAAALLPPARPDRSVDDKARELGALVVVSGGDYQPGNGALTTVQLFVGAERIWALDSSLRPLLVIPAAEIKKLHVCPVKNGTSLRLEWQDHSAEFLYRGFFAEHLAVVAEASIRNAARTSLPILPQREEPSQEPRSRAAGA